MTMTAYHPEPNEHGWPVALTKPSTASPLSSWLDAAEAATVIPRGALPDALNGIALAQWRDVPATAAAWNAVEGQCALDEPPFDPPPGKAPAAGVVVLESDGRVWLVAPSNRFGGYAATFPKGRIEHGVNPQATAIREAYEEAGLKVEITGFLADSNRTQSYTRYYLARRTGGNPARMGWESQAVHLVPRALLASFLAHPNDLPLLKALEAAAPCPGSGAAPGPATQPGRQTAESVIPQGLLDAYHATHYRVLAPEAFTLRTGVRSDALLDLYRASGTRTAAFLTAWNPYSVTVPDAQNRRAQASLLQRLGGIVKQVLPAIGFDPAATQPGEESVLALGLTMEEAIAIGREFHQNALVWIGSDAVPELILLR